MSSFAPGGRIMASWLGGPWQPAIVLEVGAGGLLRVRFDDGRETWLASMNARLTPNAPAPPAPHAPVAAPSPPAPLSAPLPPTVPPPPTGAVPPTVPPPPGAFNPFKPG